MFKVDQGELDLFAKGLSRRQFMKWAGMLGLALAAPWTASGRIAHAQEAPAGGLARSTTRVIGMQNSEMDFQLLRQLGATGYGGASVGETLAIAREIKDGDPSSWSQAFERLGRFQLDDAESRESKGHRVSAREQYLKASNSFRAAEYFTPFDEPRHRELGLASRKAFIASMHLQDHTFTEVRLPFGDIWLPAYLMTPGQSSGPAKTLMIVSGFDGTLEESYFMGGRAGLDRGYNVLHFAGPGQMDTMRFHPQATFIPDYERVATAAVDYALTRPEIDPRHLGLLGISYGGYFAIRAAAYEHRIRAVIANSPIIDLHAYVAAFAGFDPAQMPDEDDFGLAELPLIPEELMSPVFKESTASTILRFGKSTIKKTYKYLEEFRVKELHRVTCPALGMVGDGEGAEPIGQYHAFLNGVSGPAQGHMLNAMQGADSHSAVANLRLGSAVMYDWLDETFGSVE